MSQIVEKSPFLKVDRQMVLGVLKSTGSRDPDVHHTQKTALMSAARFPKMAGLYLMVLGGLLTVLILTAIIGIPMIVLGWWLRGRAVRNVKVVEETYNEYVGMAAA